jgi:hypothetical protein
MFWLPCSSRSAQPNPDKEMSMKRALIALLTAACFAAVAALPSPADAQGRAERQFLRALGTGAAIVGAALLFGAAARAHMDPQYHAFAPVQGYYYYPQYTAAPLAPCPGGFWAYKMNKHGQPVGEPKWFCPPQGYSAQQYMYQ